MSIDIVTMGTVCCTSQISSRLYVNMEYKDSIHVSVWTSLEYLTCWPWKGKGLGHWNFFTQFVKQLNDWKASTPSKMNRQKCCLKFAFFYILMSVTLIPLFVLPWTTYPKSCDELCLSLIEIRGQILTKKLCLLYCFLFVLFIDFSALWNEFFLTLT